jgi:hypothetical protein
MERKEERKYKKKGKKLKIITRIKEESERTGNK